MNDAISGLINFSKRDRDMSITSNDNWRCRQLFNGDSFFIRTIEYQWTMSSSAIDFVDPLFNQYIRKDDKRFQHKVRNHETNGGDSFSESHFIGDNTTVNGVRRKFILLTPLNPVILVLLKINARFLYKPVKSLHLNIDMVVDVFL